MKRLVAVAAALLLYGCGEAEPPPGPLVGQRVDAVFARLDGGRDSLADHRGKTVVLNFWATWCPPCRWEMPSLQALSDRLDPERFVVLGVAVREKPMLVRSYLREKGLSFAQHVDAEGEQWSRLGLDSVPATLVIGPDGVVRAQEMGERDWSDPALARRLGLN